MSKFTRNLQAIGWTIAIVDNSLEEIVQGTELKYRKIKFKSKGVWYADPFILDVTDTHYHILVEEYLYSLNRARISKIIVNKETMELEKVIPLLSLPTHLSYPAIIREEDKIYVYPENGLSGKLTRYIYDKEKEVLLEDRIIMEGALADATITFLYGSEFLFCTRLPDCNGKDLEIYKQNERGQFELFQIYKFKENVARMAGDVVEVCGNVYRFAQDCNRSYGNGTVVQKIDFNNNSFEFTEIARYFSNDKEYPVGIHTINSYKGVVVIDLFGKARYPICAILIKTIKKIVNVFYKLL